MPTAALPGIDVYYELGGEGPRVLFVNGSGATLATMAPLLGVFRPRCTLLAHDQRGLGRTSSPPTPWTMAQYAADALALLDHVGWETARVIGVSFGGMVAQELAVTAPERVERLVLACTSPGGAGGSSYPLHELHGLDPAEAAEVGLRILDTRFTPEYLAEHPDALAFLGRMAAGDGGAAKDEQVVAGERAQLEARRGHDVWDRLHRVTCPTLVAAGRYDGIAPLANSEAIASRVAGAELRVYDGGHAFFAQDPRALPELVDFVAA